MINLEVDGKPVQVENGATVMEAANMAGAFVKQFRSEFEYHIEHKRCQVKHGGYSSADPDAAKMAAD
jgi:hypothetical protein